MDESRFDDLTRKLGKRSTRRRVLGGLAGGFVGSMFARDASARDLTICHATGDPESPYESMTVAQSEFNLHARHGDFLRVECCADSECANAYGACGAGECQTGYCAQLPLAAGTPCDDELFCNEGSACDGAFNCVAGDPIICPASRNQCAAVVCDEAAQGCVETPRPAGTPCHSGIPCTENDHCDGGFHCVVGDPLTCNPIDQCFSAICDPNVGDCITSGVLTGNACVTDENTAGACNANGDCIAPGCGEGPACAADEVCINDDCFNVLTSETARECELHSVPCMSLESPDPAYQGLQFCVYAIWFDLADVCQSNADCGVSEICATTISSEGTYSRCTSQCP